MSIRRQKVNIDNDPLSLFLSQGNNNNKEEEEDDEENEYEKLKQEKQKEEELKNEKLKSKTLVNTLAPGRDIDFIPKKEEKEVKNRQENPNNNLKIVEEEKKDIKIASNSVVTSQPQVQSQKSTSTPISTTVPTQVPIKKQEVKTTPQGPTSVFESGDDIFLKKPTTTKTITSTLDDELFGSNSGELSELKSSKVNTKVTIRGDESDEEEKYDDLAVGQLLEREELDFETFGRSKVRQYESKPVKSNPTIYQDDFILEDEDDLNQMESILSNTKLSGYETKTKYSTNNTKSTSISNLDVDSLDINAYISQQENSSGGLFD